MIPLLQQMQRAFTVQEFKLDGPIAIIPESVAKLPTPKTGPNVSNINKMLANARNNRHYNHSDASQCMMGTTYHHTEKNTVLQTIHLGISGECWSEIYGMKRSFFEGVDITDAARCAEATKRCIYHHHPEVCGQLV